jgi:predicted metal-dependent phosphoesterase TrpH
LFSDGLKDIDYLVGRAETLRLDVTALTDHDTVAGVRAMAAAGAAAGIRVLTGIEISAFDGQEVHILGYNVDLSGNSPLVGSLQRMREARRERMRRIVANLNGMGFPMTFDEVCARARCSASRSHIAAVMVDKGYVDSVQRAVDLYLGIGRPAFVDFFVLPPAEAVSLVRGSGGVPVLAHPGRMTLAKTEFPGFIARLKDAGLMGIESAYPAHSKEQTKFFRAQARTFGLINTAGSDFHGVEKVLFSYELEKETVRALGL